MKIAIALSGGVDSSLAAALLREAGHEVFGLFMRMVGEDAPPPFVPSDPTDARRVADHLRIPLHVLDLPDALDALVAYFCSEYDAGRTPNPCVLCNKWNKFGRLLASARALGAERLATGHYARILDCRLPIADCQLEIGNRKSKMASARWLLLRARHRAKDQSYMLCGLGQSQLAHALFPLGEFSKDEVRRMARERGLPVHEREESQDLCFLPARRHVAHTLEQELERGTPADGGISRVPRPSSGLGVPGGTSRNRSHVELLRRCIGERLVPGPILDTQGRLLGTHPGCQCFTIGQRRGLGVAAGSPRYVVRIDRAANAVVIGTREELRRDSMLVSQVNWIAFDTPPPAFEATVQIRYNHQPVPALIEPLADGGARVTFRTPETGVTPGQAAVFYDAGLVLGGGWIEAGP